MMNLSSSFRFFKTRTVIIKSFLDSDKHIWPNTIPKSIPYDGPPTKDPNKRMKKGQEGLWLDAIEREMKYYSHGYEYPK